MEFSDIWTVNFKSAKKVVAETPEETEADFLKCEGCGGTGIMGNELRINPRTLSPEDRDVRCTTCYGTGRATKQNSIYDFTHSEDETPAPGESGHPSLPCPSCDAALTRSGATPEQVKLTQAGVSCPSCHQDLSTFDPSTMDEDNYSEDELEYAREYWNTNGMKGAPYTLCPSCHMDIEGEKAEANWENYARGMYEYYMEGERAKAEDPEYWRR